MSTPSSDSADAPPLPPPSRPDPAPRPPAAVRGRPGDLTPAWRMLLGLAWVLAFFSYAAIWNASVQIGIGTWWVGPRAQPTFILVKLLPFVLCLAMVLCIVYNAPRMVRISAIATVATAIWAIPDFSRSIGLGVAELTVAGLLAIGTAAALTGRYRLAPATASGDSVGETDDHVAVTRPPSALPPPPS